jgi:hypothetical protein
VTELTFQPQNKLEKMLVKAANDPMSRLDFYRELQASNIFVIQVDSEVNIQDGILNENQTVKLLNVELNGKMYIPIFSSLLRLQEFVDTEVSYLSMNSIDFFTLTKDADVIMNPRSSYGKEFNKEEIDTILNGTIYDPSQRYEVKKDTKVMIGQPANNPTELIAELIKFFSTKKEVKCAYNAHFYNPEFDDHPHTLIAVKVSGNWDEVIAKAGMIANAVKIPDPPVDFIQLDENSDFQQYFRTSCKPFYKKKSFGIF